MFKLFFRRKYLVVILILIPILLYALYVHVVTNTQVINESTQIFEIKNTQIISYSRDSKIATIEKNYMIIKPPDDLNELKALIEKFDKENPINMEIYENEVTKTNSITADKIIRKDIYIRFYRESSKLPRNWQPNEAYMNTDRIEHHGNDCIASIVYLDSGQHKSYSVMKKSKNVNELTPIERIEYIDDKVVNHAVEKNNN